MIKVCNGKVGVRSTFIKKSNTATTKLEVSDLVLGEALHLRPHGDPVGGQVLYLHKYHQNTSALYRTFSSMLFRLPESTYVTSHQ
jgi:hypothetical protein